MPLAVDELVSRARGGDADAYAELIARYERSALAVAYGRLGEPHAAGDAVQEGFLKAWQELPRLEDAKKFGGWLLRIVRNAAVDIGRKRRGAGQKIGSLDAMELDVQAPRDAGPEAPLEAHETARSVQDALMSLDDMTRTMVTLRYYEGLSSREIADALDVSPASVDMRLSRARALLKQKLAAEVFPTQEAPVQGAGDHR